VTAVLSQFKMAEADPDIFADRRMTAAPEAAPGRMLAAAAVFDTAFRASALCCVEVISSWSIYGTANLNIAAPRSRSSRNMSIRPPRI
jgi:hypothetical protein